MSTTNQTSAANKEQNVVPPPSPTRDNTNSLSWNSAKRKFSGEEHWEEEKVDEVPPTPGDEQPTEAPEVTAEASATSAGGGTELDQCCHFAQKGNKSTRCTNEATVTPFSGKKKHLVYCQACNDDRKKKKETGRAKRGRHPGRSRLKGKTVGCWM